MGMPGVVRLRSMRRGLGWLLLASLAGFALLGPLLISHDPIAQDLSLSLAPPDARHWLGTDVLGRSVLARLAEATRLSVGLAWLAALTAAVPGVLLGVLAAWRGGRVDAVLQLLSDAVMSMPGLLLVLLMATLAPGQGWALYTGLSLVLWVEFFRVTRVTSRPVLSGEAVEASRLLGLGMGHVLRHHVAAALGPVLGTLLAFATAQAVLATAALGFISVGLQPPTPELGLMMTEFLPYYHEAPWLMAGPVAVLAWLVLGMMCLVPTAGEEVGS